MLRDQAMQERSLDLFYDTAPNPFDAVLFTGDPDLGGVELSGNGYADGTVDVADWNPAADGVKSTEAVVFGAPTGVWETARWVGLRDSVTGEWADVVPLAEPLDVTGAGVGPELTISVFYDNNLD